MSRGRTMVVGVCILALPMLMGAKPTSRLFKDATQVELFSAISDGDLEVKLIPKDATESTVIFKNLTKKPLRIQLPAAFAGIPVLAQDGGDFGDFGGGGGGLNDPGGQNQNQALGGGMGGGMMGGGMGGGMMGGMMNVAPARVQKVKVATVCLEHGKKDPNPRIAYKIAPLQEFTTNPHVHEVCAALGRGKVDQVSAQAATWHLTDRLNWRELATKIKTRHLNGTVDMYFSPRNMQVAMQLVNFAKHRVTARESTASAQSPGEADEQL